MRKFKHYLMIGLVLSGVYGLRGGDVHAQAGEKSTFEGLGYSLELPEGWSGKSNYFANSGFSELAFLMPSPVPDLPRYESDEAALDVIAKLGHLIEPGYWLEELTTQPGVVLYNARYGGDREAASIREVAMSVVSNNDSLGNASFNMPVGATLNGRDVQIVTGTVEGSGALQGYVYSFYAVGIQRAGQLVAIIGFSPTEITPGVQATFEAITESFQFEPFPTLELPKLAPDQHFEIGEFAFDYPDGWSLYPSNQISSSLYRFILAPDGIDEERIQTLNGGDELTLAPGEKFIILTRGTPNEYTGDYFEPEYLLPALPAAITRVGIYEFQGESWLEYQATSEGFEASVFATKRGEALASVIMLAAPGAKIDPTPAYTILSSLTIKAGEQGQGIDLPFLPD